MKRTSGGAFSLDPDEVQSTPPPSLIDTLDLVHGIRKARRSKGRSSDELLWRWSRTHGYRHILAVMAEAGIEGPRATPKGLRHCFGVIADVSSRNQGEVSAGGAADGDWAFSGGGQVPFDLDLGETFATFVDTGGSGDSMDPIKVFSRADNNGRFYSAQMSAVPEPLALQSIEVNDLLTTVTLTWNSRPGRFYALELSESMETWLEIDDGASRCQGIFLRAPGRNCARPLEWGRPKALLGPSPQSMSY